MNKKLKSDILLLLTAIIWGVSFVAQRAGMEYIGPFTFNTIRMILGALVLLPVIWFLSRRRSSQIDEGTSITDKAQEKKLLIIGGISCGTALFIASSFQQIGMVYTTAGKGGFITALYVVLVPIFGIFLKKKVRPILWISVLLAIVGLYLLSITEDFTIGKGDLLVLICAVFFAIHILIIDHFSPKVDGVKLSAIQFFICGVIGIPFMFALEQVNMSSIIDCAVPILYSAVMSCGIAYTLQVIAQKDADPTVASLLLSLESVFAVIGGVIILHEQITGREFLGITIMFVAIVLSQLPSKEVKLPEKI